MYLGPIHPTLPGLGTGHNPVKPIKISSSTGKQVVLFDQEYPYPTQSSPVAIAVGTVVYESTVAAAIARLTQIAELAQNTEWHRCGLFIQWREDGVQDPEDGWYVISAADISEEFLFSAYGEPSISTELRARQRASIGVYVDSKAVSNDANLSGVGLAALPMGFATQFPAATWTFAGSNGNIPVFENPLTTIRATLVTPITTMTQGRCRVSDQTINRSTQTEVFWKDHRNINGNWEISNDLVRYYFAEGAASPSIDVWDAYSAAWVNLGNYQLQVTNTGPVLPLQTVQFQTISPEEVIWVERRFDALGTALVSVTNRLRRGSRLIESQIVAASGAGLTGTQSIGIVSAPALASAYLVTQSADLTGVVAANANFSDGFDIAGSVATVHNDAFATLNALTTFGSAPSVAANLITLGAGAGADFGHLDWQDATYTVRFKWATNGKMWGKWHVGTRGGTGGAASYIYAEADGVNLTLNTQNQGGLASVAAALVNGTFYWLRVSGVGTSYTATIFNDSAGALGTQLATTGATTIAIATLQAGCAGFYNNGSAAIQVGGAFSNVCTVSQTVANGWLFEQQAGDVVSGCWDAINRRDGAHSVSIYYPTVNGSGDWKSPNITNAGLNNPVKVAFFVKGPVTGTAVTAVYFPDGAENLTGTLTTVAGLWTANLLTFTPTNSTTSNLLLRAGPGNAGSGAGTYYFDSVAVYQTAVVPGFSYLTANPTVGTSTGTSLWSGAIVPAGTVTRIGILAGVIDGQYTSLGTAALYAATWAAYNRQRIRQRVLVGLVA